MQAVGGGAGAVAFALLVLLAIVTISLLLYGSVLASLGTAKKQGVGLAIGNSLIALGAYLMINGQRIIYNVSGDPSTNSVLQQQIGLSSICLGLLVFSVSFVLYVKKHNE